MKYFLLGIILTLAFSSSGYTSYSKPRAIRVSMEYLQVCEVGPDCKPIMIRRKRGEQLELALPAMFRTSVTIWDEENYSKFLKRTGTYLPIQRTGTGNTTELKEIVLALSKLKDGTYYVWIVGDSVGGTFQVHLKTE